MGQESILNLRQTETGTGAKGAIGEEEDFSFFENSNSNPQSKNNSKSKIGKNKRGIGRRSPLDKSPRDPHYYLITNNNNINNSNNNINHRTPLASLTSKEKEKGAPHLSGTQSSSNSKKESNKLIEKGEIYFNKENKNSQSISNSNSKAAVRARAMPASIVHTHPTAVKQKENRDFFEAKEIQNLVNGGRKFKSTTLYGSGAGTGALGARSRIGGKVKATNKTNSEKTTPTKTFKQPTTNYYKTNSTTFKSTPTKKINQDYNNNFVKVNTVRDRDTSVFSNNTETESETENEKGTESEDTKFLSASVDFTKLKFQNYNFETKVDDDEDGVVDDNDNEDDVDDDMHIDTFDENIPPRNMTLSSPLVSGITTLRELDNQTNFSPSGTRSGVGGGSGSGSGLRSSLTSISSEDSHMKLMSKSLNSFNIKKLEKQLKRVKEETNFYKNERERILNMYKSQARKSNSRPPSASTTSAPAAARRSISSMSNISLASSLSLSESTLSDNYNYDPGQLSLLSDKLISLKNAAHYPFLNDTLINNDLYLDKEESIKNESSNNGSETDSVTNLKKNWFDNNHKNNNEDEDTEPDEEMEGEGQKELRKGKEGQQEETEDAGQVGQRREEGYTTPNRRDEKNKMNDGKERANEILTRTITNTASRSVPSSSSSSVLNVNDKKEKNNNSSNNQINSNNIKNNKKNIAYSASTYGDFVVDENWEGDEVESWENDDEEEEDFDQNHNSNEEEEKEDHDNNGGKEQNKRNGSNNNNSNHNLSELWSLLKIFFQKLYHDVHLQLFILFVLLVCRLCLSFTSISFSSPLSSSTSSFSWNTSDNNNSNNNYSDNKSRVERLPYFKPGTIPLPISSSSHFTSPFYTNVYEETKENKYNNNSNHNKNNMFSRTANIINNIKNNNSSKLLPKIQRKKSKNNKNRNNIYKEITPSLEGNLLFHPKEYISSCTMLVYYYNELVLKQQQQQPQSQEQEEEFHCLSSSSSPLSTTSSPFPSFPKVYDTLTSLKASHPLCTFSQLFLYFHDDYNLYLFEGETPADIFSSSSSPSPSSVIVSSPLWSTNIEKIHVANSKSNDIVAAFNSKRKSLSLYDKKKRQQSQRKQEERKQEEEEEEGLIWRRGWYRLPRVYLQWLLPESHTPHYYHHQQQQQLQPQPQQANANVISIHTIDNYWLTYRGNRNQKNNNNYYNNSMAFLLPYFYQILSPLQDPPFPEYVFFFIHLPSFFSFAKNKLNTIHKHINYQINRSLDDINDKMQKINEKINNNKRIEEIKKRIGEIGVARRELFASALSSSLSSLSSSFSSEKKEKIKKKIKKGYKLIKKRSQHMKNHISASLSSSFSSFSSLSSSLSSFCESEYPLLLSLIKKEEQIMKEKAKKKKEEVERMVRRKMKEAKALWRKMKEKGKKFKKEFEKKYKE